MVTEKSGLLRGEAGPSHRYGTLKAEYDEHDHVDSWYVSLQMSLTIDRIYIYIYIHKVIGEL